MAIFSEYFKIRPFLVIIYFDIAPSAVTTTFTPNSQGQRPTKKPTSQTTTNPHSTLQQVTIHSTTTFDMAEEEKVEDDVEIQMNGNAGDPIIPSQGNENVSRTDTQLKQLLQLISWVEKGTSEA
jgi:hypothetical protein